MVWAEKRTPSRPRVQVFDTPPGPHVRTNHLGNDLVCGRKLVPVGALRSAAPNEHQLFVVNERMFAHLRFVASSKTAGHFLRTETSHRSQSLVPADVEAQEVSSCAC